MPQTKNLKPSTSPQNAVPAGSWRSPETHFKNAIEHKWYVTVARILSGIQLETNDFYIQRKMLPALMPITCGSVSSPMGLGSDSLPVKISLFEKETYLADSMQFHLEYMLRLLPEGVWYIMPTFRGEDHDARHLNQFFHSEAEIIGSFQDVQKLVNEYVHHLTAWALHHYKKDIELFSGTTKHLEDFLDKQKNIPSISFEDAKKIIPVNIDGIETIAQGIEKVTHAGEAYLADYFGGAVWLTDPPYKSVPFYQAHNEGRNTATCGDLILGKREIVGAGQRHTDAGSLERAMTELQIDPTEYAWYIRMKKEYPLQTSGFGLGIERYVAWLFGHDDIRDIHIIPRLKGIDCVP